MRPIDAEPLEEILRLRCMQCSGDYGSISGAVSGCLKLVQAQPTITQASNDPLKLNELQGMDEPFEDYNYGETWLAYRRKLEEA